MMIIDGGTYFEVGGPAMAMSEVRRPIAAFIYFYCIIINFFTERWGARPPPAKKVGGPRPPWPPLFLHLWQPGHYAWSLHSELC